MLFRGSGWKFIGFMLTRIVIEINLNKFQSFIIMRSSNNVKEVHQLTGFLATLSRFLSYTYENAFLFFATLNKKKNIFKYTSKCENEFTKLKEFLTSLPILTRLKEESSLLLYLLVTDQAISFVLV